MDGRPLHEYARQGIPLPRPIEKRPVRVDALEVVHWLGSEHTFRPPTKALSAEAREKVETALSLVTAEPTVSGAPVAEEAPGKSDDDQVPTAFKVSMTVSGGTYVRSIVHDLAHAVGSAGHVVTLTRTRQGRFALDPTGEEIGCVSWDVFERASAADSENERDADGWTEWERVVRDHLEVVE
jgi:tRNA pseudouridine55 synthase